jgi:multidrug efflux pump subunit AcrA (membrane-fusion protein)
MGQVVYVDEDKIGTVLSKKKFIKIDDTLDRKELSTLKAKREYLEDTLALTLEIEKNLQEVLARKKVNYKRVEAMSIKSRVEKDREFYTYITSQNNYIATKKEIDNLRVQIADIKLRERNLQKSIHDKNVIASGKLLYNLEVKKGQVVNKGTPLAKLADISHALVTIYVSAEDLEGIKDKVVYIDGKKTAYKVSRFVNVADTQHISAYKVEIIVDAPKIFSKLVQVELKGK